MAERLGNLQDLAIDLSAVPQAHGQICARLTHLDGYIAVNRALVHHLARHQGE